MKKMKKQRFSKHLPSEIITEILSRLPAEAIVRSKCVCKSWLGLVNSNEFAKFHLSKSVPGLVLTEELVGRRYIIDMQHHILDDPQLSTITKLSFSSRCTWIMGSVDGLLLLQMLDWYRNLELRLCNPITREYIYLHYVQPLEYGLDIFGFGVSKITRQYKVVFIFQNIEDVTPEKLPVYVPECKVYTIGTGSWRSIAPHASLRFNRIHAGAFVNGNLHWMSIDLNCTIWISCFDLETELFTTFSPPPSLPSNDKANVFHGFLVAVEGSLCFCDYSSDSDMFIIWLMKEYGVQKSWTKEFVIKKIDSNPPLFVYPIKITNGGVFLTACKSDSLFYYSSNTKTTQKIFSSQGSVYANSYPHTPSLLSLKSFTMENSIEF